MRFNIIDATKVLLLETKKEVDYGSKKVVFNTVTNVVTSMTGKTPIIKLKSLKKNHVHIHDSDSDIDED